MSRLRRDIKRRKLGEFLAKADDLAFCRLIWAVDALQSGQVEAAAQVIRFPTEAATSDIGSRYALYKWELETLVTLLLGTSKQEVREGRNVQLNCSIFDSAAWVAKCLRELQEAESSLYLTRFGILSELHRIAQRTFSWQRGYFNIPQLYRYAHIYNFGECAVYFEQTHGLTINEFSMITFALYSAFLTSPSVNRSVSLAELRICSQTFERALKLLALPLRDARRQAALLVNETGVPAAYKKSLLRQYPIILFAGQPDLLCAPLPQLLALRATAGLFYDLLGGKAQLRNEASARFEHYCSELVRRLLPRFRVHGSSKYRNGGNEVDTPDIFLADGGEVKVIIECKARRLSFEAQFSEDPGRDAKAGYEEMAKGVFQLWRHFSHARQGIAPAETTGPSAYGLVLTLDSWLAMSQDLADHVFSLAHSLADEQGEIAALDRKSVAFCSIADFEFLLAACNEDGFLRTIAAASEARFRGWLLPGIMRHLGEAHESAKDFPFGMGEVLPWWNEIPKMRPAEAG